MAAKIKKGDKVVVLAGKDRGAKGEVIQVMPQADRVLVRGVNLIKRHQRQTQATQGGRIPTPMPIDLSNLAFLDANGKATRVGFKIEDGKKVRFAKSTGDVIDA